MASINIKNRIAEAKKQLALKQKHPTDKSKNYVACNMCVVSGIPLFNSCKEYIHRRDQLLQHVKTVHKITYTGKARQYEYEFDNRTQSTLPFAKKSRGDDNEPRGAVAADMSVEEKMEVEKDVDVDTQSTKLSLQLPDTNEVGAYKEPTLSLR